jgi:cytochrome c oxidase cbb3-type subunit 3
MIKRITSTALLAAVTLQEAVAQAGEAAVTNTDPEAVTPQGMNTSGVMLLFVMLGLLLFVILFLYRIFRSLKVEFYGEDPKPAGAPAWKKIASSMQEAVPVEQEHDIMTDHVYDGIRELDNNLPLWWRYMFYGTIVFSFIYLIRYHMGGGDLQDDEYRKELAMAEIKKEEYRKKNAANVDETTVTMMDAAGIEAGKTLFNENCRACHGGAGEGGVGPNLTDDYWLHGGGISNIFKSIKYGWPDKGMKSWQAELKPVQLQQVSSYIMNLRGSKPANAKEPQGDIYVEEDAPSDSLKSDSVKVALVEVK